MSLNKRYKLTIILLFQLIFEVFRSICSVLTPLKVLKIDEYSYYSRFDFHKYLFKKRKFKNIYVDSSCLLKQNGSAVMA